MLFWRLMLPLLSFASLAEADGLNPPDRTIQEYIEAASSQPIRPLTVEAWMRYFESQGWGVKYGGKGWMQTPQNVSERYEIPTNEGCVPRFIDMFLCHQCNKECLLDWIALHKECPQTKLPDVKDLVEALIKHGTIPSELGQMLAQEMRSNMFRDIPATLRVEGCTLSKISVRFTKAIRRQGFVFNVTTKGSKDTTIFLIDGQDPIVSNCGLLQPENAWFCEPVHVVSKKERQDVGWTLHMTGLIIFTLLFLLCVVLCYLLAGNKLRCARGDKKEASFSGGQVGSHTSSAFLSPIVLEFQSQREEEETVLNDVATVITDFKEREKAF